jgi:hypothetical protein
LDLCQIFKRDGAFGMCHVAGGKHAQNQSQSNNGFHGEILQNELVSFPEWQGREEFVWRSAKTLP